jgi:hypothetical protein
MLYYLFEYLDKTYSRNGSFSSHYFFSLCIGINFIAWYLPFMEKLLP